jgi:hypothetical protein
MATKEELIEEAQRRGIDVDDDASKAELQAALEGAVAEESGTDLAPLVATATEDTGPIDSTPGAMEPDQEPDSVGEDDVLEPIPVGTWVRLADTENVEEQGAEPGMLATVVESPKTLAQPGDDDLSPREHYVQNTELEITVRERGFGSREFSLTRDDFQTVATSGRNALLPHG